MISIIRTAFTLVLAASATIATVGIATPVLAAHAPTAAVEVGLRNLANPAVRARVEAQVQRAARQVCVRHGLRQLAEMRAEQACVATAVANALPQVEMLAARSARGMVAAVTAPTSHVGQ